MQQLRLPAQQDAPSRAVAHMPITWEHSAAKTGKGGWWWWLCILEQLLSSLLPPSLPESRATPQCRAEFICSQWSHGGSAGSPGCAQPGAAGGLEPGPGALEAVGGLRAKALWCRSVLLPVGDAWPRCSSSQPTLSASCPAKLGSCSCDVGHFGSV